ncbi:unnamed protein product [Ixodes pacificus]
MIKGEERTFEGLHGHVGDQGVQLVGRVLVLVSAASQPHPHAEGHIPAEWAQLATMNQRTRNGSVTSLRPQGTWKPNRSVPPYTCRDSNSSSTMILFRSGAAPLPLRSRNCCSNTEKSVAARLAPKLHRVPAAAVRRACAEAWAPTRNGQFEEDCASTSRKAKYHIYANISRVHFPRSAAEKHGAD